MEEIVKALCKQKQFLLEEQERTGNTPDTQLVYVTGEAVFKILELIHRLQGENERLTEENGQLKGYNSGLEYENAELQQQVDELKTNQVIECHGMLKGCDMVKQAVKETAKEILTDAKKWVKEHYKDKVTDSFGERPMLFMEAFGCLLAYLKDKHGVEVE